MDKEKLNKLPKWAQDEILKLKSNLKRAEKEISELYGNEATNTSICAFAKNKPLPKNCTIDFDLGSGGNIISCNIVDGELRIYGKEVITVLPRAANSIYIV